MFPNQTRRRVRDLNSGRLQLVRETESDRHVSEAQRRTVMVTRSWFGIRYCTKFVDPGEFLQGLVYSFMAVSDILDFFPDDDPISFNNQLSDEQFQVAT